MARGEAAYITIYGPLQPGKRIGPVVPGADRVPLDSTPDELEELAGVCGPGTYYAWTRDEDGHRLDPIQVRVGIGGTVEAPAAPQRPREEPEPRRSAPASAAPGPGNPDVIGGFAAQLLDRYHTTTEQARSDALRQLDAERAREAAEAARLDRVVAALQASHAESLEQFRRMADELAEARADAAEHRTRAAMLAEYLPDDDDAGDSSSIVRPLIEAFASAAKGEKPTPHRSPSPFDD